MKPSFTLFLVSLLILKDTVLVLGEKDGENGGENGGGNGRGNGDGNNGDGERLKMMYYQKSCSSVNTIVRDITWRRAAENPSLAAKLLRLHFHDCFVRGCDASILLDSIDENHIAEKEAIPNLSLSGFDVIDEIKAKLEQECPGVVSCADIVALAARDAVSYQFQRPMWDVLSGRKDGRVSMMSEALRDIPSPFSNFTTLLNQFQSKGLDLADLVILSGAHTIGDTHCFLLNSRLYNFTGNGDADPSLNPDYAQTLRTICPNNSPNPTKSVEMDPQSSFSFDSHYYQALDQNKGIFVSDATLLTNPQSTQMVKVLQNSQVFFARFAQSIKKMAAIGVLGEDEGEVRQNCRVVN